MTIFRDRDDPLEDWVGDDPVDGQVRDDPNPDLLHQHDEERDPLDSAILDEGELAGEEVADESVRDALVDVVKERVRAEGESQEPSEEDTDTHVEEGA